MDAKPRLFRSRQAWREWLALNHDKSKGLWLAYYKKGSGKKSITYEEALQEALCFGWIDSTIARLDAEKYKQKYTPRNEKSVWSPSNKTRVGRLLSEGLMSSPGLARVDAAKKNGSWDRPSDPERVGRATEPPADLHEALARNSRAAAVFEGRPPSERRLWALWVVSAKKPETRARRIAETIARILAGRRPGY
jgi:uncharacterized protein YdeI (YjbR/CyaY-like superfamily)